MSGGLSFCQDANQSLQVLGTVISNGNQNDVKLNYHILRMVQIGLLEKEKRYDFANRMKFGGFLMDHQENFKSNPSLYSKEQAIALDEALQEILGRRIYS